MRVITLLVAGLVASVNRVDARLLGWPQQPAIRSEPRLDTRIPAPVRLEYRAIREERDWRNPHLLVSKGGFRLRSLSAPEPRLVELKDLRRILTELPVSDWPYGRVVVVQWPSIGGSIEATQPNYDGALAILKALDADWWGWPP
jgi:hypothetical protein